MLLDTVRIREKFTEQYSLEIESNLMAVNAVMRSKTRIRWDLQVLACTEESVECRIVLLDQILVDSNNPLISEIGALTRTFSRMYNELHLQTDHAGTIQEIFNLDAIQKKWAETKVELNEIANSNPEIKNIIVLNDSIFLSPGNLIAYIQRSEFFLLFFNSFYGKPVPLYTGNYVMPNFLSTANLYWTKKLITLQSEPGRMLLRMQAAPTHIPADFNERAYAQFKNYLPIKKLKPELQESGLWLIDEKDGRVLEASLNRTEIVDENELFSKIFYRFRADSLEKEMLTKQTKSTMEYA